MLLVLSENIIYHNATCMPGWTKNAIFPTRDTGEFMPKNGIQETSSLPPEPWSFEQTQEEVEDEAVPDPYPLSSVWPWVHSHYQLQGKNPGAKKVCFLLSLFWSLTLRAVLCHQWNHRLAPSLQQANPSIRKGEHTKIKQTRVQDIPVLAGQMPCLPWHGLETAWW